MAVASLGINATLNAGNLFAGLGRLEGAIKGIGSVGGKALAAPVAAVGAIGKAGGAAVGALGGIGLAAMGVGAIGDAAKGAAGALGIGLNSSIEDVRAQLTAFTKSGTEADRILGMIRSEAAATPFGFQEMAKATASLLPASKQSGVGLMQLVKQAEILAALNPAEGLEGAAFSLREALSGDFVSIIERFNLPRQRLNELKAQGVPAMEAISTAMREMGVDASLVTNLAGTFSGRMSTFQDTIDTLRQRLSAPLFKILSDQLVVLQKFFDDNADAIGAWVDRVGAGIGRAAQRAVDGIGALFDGIKAFRGALSGDWMGTEGIRTFAEMAGRAGVFLADMRYAAEGLIAVWQGGDVFEDNPIYQFVPFLRAAVPVIKMFADTFLGTFRALGTAVQTAMGGDVVGAITGFLSYFVQSRATLVQTLAGWGQAFVGWLAPFIPPLLAELGNLLGQAFAWVQSQAPGWIEQLMAWGQQFVAWVSPFIPPLLAELGAMAERLFAWVGEQVPGWLATLAEWGTAFIGWIEPMIPPMMTKLGQMVKDLLNWLGQQAPPLVERFLTEWVPAFVGWVVPATLQLIQALDDWWKGGGSDAIGTFALNMGKAIVVGILQGLANLGIMLTNFIIGELSKVTIDLGPAGQVNLGEKLGLKQIEMIQGSQTALAPVPGTGITPGMAAAAATGVPTATDPTAAIGPSQERLDALDAQLLALTQRLAAVGEAAGATAGALTQVPDHVRSMHSDFMSMA